GSFLHTGHGSSRQTEPERIFAVRRRAKIPRVAAPGAGDFFPGKGWLSLDDCESEREPARTAGRFESASCRAVKEIAGSCYWHLLPSSGRMVRGDPRRKVTARK